MRRAITYLIYLVIFVLLLLLPSAIRYLRYYGVEGAEQQPPPVYEPASVPARVPTPAAGDFVDDPEVGQGWVVLDAAHDNRFELGEINYLDSRLAARGYELLPYKEGDLASALRPASAFVVIAPMTNYSEDEVRAIAGFVERGGRLLLVGDPTRFELTFDEEEDFDPFSYSVATDEIALNSLANEFDLIFNGDYLYNTVDNEGNFQNIVLDQAGFSDDDLTQGLEQLAFYGSHSIQAGPGGRQLLSAGDDTWSSATDRSGGLALAALGADDRVLALGDIDFLSEPYYTVYDNSRFISQIADFLVTADRQHLLADFPFFYDQQVQLVYTGDPELGPNAFDDVVGLQRALRATGRQLSLAGEAAGQSATLYAGLYNQAAELGDVLDAAGISLIIEPPVESDPTAAEDAEEETVAEEAVAEEAVDEDAAAEESAGDETAAEDTAAADEDAAEADTIVEEDGGQADEAATEEEVEMIRRIESDLGNVAMSGTALILLTGQGQQRQVVVLAASAEGLDNTLARLVSLSSLAAEPALEDCLLQEDLALCPTGVEDELVEFELITGDQPAAAEPAGVEEPPDEPPAGGPGDLELDADIQGPIGLGETVEATMAEEQSHGWEFSAGPATVNIVLQAGDDMDGILELYDAAGSLMAAADSTFDGEEERLDLIELPDDQTYTIVARDFFQDGGSYTLSVVAVSPEAMGAVAQGELTAGEPVAGLLGEGEVHAWTFALETPAEATITLASGADLDGLFILVGPDGSVLEIVDETLAGEEESLAGYALAETGEYTVLVGEYADGGGDYILTLELSS